MKVACGACQCGNDTLLSDCGICVIVSLDKDELITRRCAGRVEQATKALDSTPFNNFNLWELLIIYLQVNREINHFHSSQ